MTNECMNWMSEHLMLFLFSALFSFFKTTLSLSDSFLYYIVPQQQYIYSIHSKIKLPHYSFLQQKEKKCSKTCHIQFVFSKGWKLWPLCASVSLRCTQGPGIETNLGQNTERKPVPVLRGKIKICSEDIWSR